MSIQQSGPVNVSTQLKDGLFCPIQFCETALAAVSDSDQKENLLILLKQAGQSDSSLTGNKKWLQRILAALRIYIVRMLTVLSYYKMIKINSTAVLYRQLNMTILLEQETTIIHLSQIHYDKWFSPTDFWCLTPSWG